MLPKIFLGLSPVLFITLIMCKKDTTSGIPGPEVFEASNKPKFGYISPGNYYFCKPWNYEKDFNATRKYPLVVYLHGSGGAGEPTDLTYLGYGDSDKATAFKSTYPVFVYAAQTPTEWDNAILISQIEQIKKDYRIDPNRIYLIGFSMGGSGSYSLANDYFDFNGQLFAGIIRLAGQTQVAVKETIAKRTSIWLHIGVLDEPVRVTVTRQAYDFLKTFHPDASETSSEVTIQYHPGTTLTLTKNNIEIVKKTEYSADGHGVNIMPFFDDNVLAWLFSQSLLKR